MKLTPHASSLVNPSIMHHLREVEVVLRPVLTLTLVDDQIDERPG
jgi:hypothetical protein